MNSRTLTLLFILACLALLLAACGSTGAGETPAPAPLATVEQASSPTSEPAASTPTRAPASTADLVVETDVLASTDDPAATVDPLSTALPTTAPGEVDLSALPIAFPIMTEEVAAYFNQIARPDDVAMIPTRNLHLLPMITSGKRQAGGPSWAQAELDLPALMDQLDIMSYNPEHWDRTPESEQADLVATVQRAAEFAHDRGFPLLVAPDRRFAKEHIGEIAKYADAIVLQGQRLQKDIPQFSSSMLEFIAAARQGNPDITIYVQIGVVQESTAEDMYNAIQTIAGEIDGINIWSNAAGLPVLKEFISMIRPEG